MVHRSDRVRIAVVPIGKKEIPRGTLDSILRQVELTEDEFRGYLR